MATPDDTLRSGKLQIRIKDPASPTDWIAPCGLVDRSFDLSSSVNEDDVPDCDNPDAPNWVARTIASLSGQASGEGVWSGASYAIWRGKFLSGAAFDARIDFDASGANGGGYWEGKFVLTALGTAGQNKRLVRTSLTLQSDGPLAWVDAA